MDNVYYGHSSVRNKIHEAGERESMQCRGWARRQGDPQAAAWCVNVSAELHACTCPGRQLGLRQVPCASYP